MIYYVLRIAGLRRNVLCNYNDQNRVKISFKMYKIIMKINSFYLGAEEEALSFKLRFNDPRALTLLYEKFYRIN